LLFNSFNFICIFLPIAIFVYSILFYIIKKFNFISNSLIFLIIAFSSVFYCYWSIKYFFLLIFSISINYYFSKLLNIRPNKKFYLTLGILFNLSLLVYFKYTNFIINNLNYITENEFNYVNLILPLGISFYTFQQISFLIDSSKKNINGLNFYRYFAYVSFFPQLIAGPIVRQHEIFHQLDSSYLFKNFNVRNISCGIMIFLIGLFKKTVIADNLAIFSDNLFNFNFDSYSYFEYWIGVLAFSLQIYFDFSAYSDMAIGLALMFGIILPFNFTSPYKVNSIIDYWKNWHITLSNFINNYIFYPFSFFLNQFIKPNSKLNINLLIILPVIFAFSISGIWHGSSWNFLIWGLIHSILIIINYYYRYLFSNFNFYKYRVTKFSNKILLFLSITLSWVPFRADNFSDMIIIIKSIFGLNSEIKLFEENSSNLLIQILPNFITLPLINYFILFLSLIIVFKFKNIKEIFYDKKSNTFNYKLSFNSGLSYGLLSLIIIIFYSNNNQPFIYFQF